MIKFIFVQANLFNPDEEPVLFLTENNNLVWIPESDEDRISLLIVGRRETNSKTALVCVAALLFVVSFFVVYFLNSHAAY